MTEWTKTFQYENKKIRNVFHRNNELEHTLQNRKQIYLN